MSVGAGGISNLTIVLDLQGNDLHGKRFCSVPANQDQASLQSAHSDEECIRLHLSGTSPTNSTFHDAEGQALYKAQTSSRIFGRTTTICRIVPNHPNGGGNRMRDVFGHIAKFEWKSFRSSRMRFRGREFKTRTFFRKQGWSRHGRHRAFVAPDGREYKWTIGSKAWELSLNDSTQALVARYYTRQRNILSGSQLPMLEVFRLGEHIMDLIIVTLVYIEKLRDDE